MQKSNRSKLLLYVFYAVVAAPLLITFHNAMNDDLASLCNSGQVYGKACYK